MFRDADRFFGLLEGNRTALGFHGQLMLAFLFQPRDPNRFDTLHGTESLYDFLFASGALDTGHRCLVGIGKRRGYGDEREEEES